MLSLLLGAGSVVADSDVFLQYVHQDEIFTLQDHRLRQVGFEGTNSESAERTVRLTDAQLAQVVTWIEQNRMLFLHAEPLTPSYALPDRTLAVRLGTNVNVVARSSASPSVEDDLDEPIRALRRHFVAWESAAPLNSSQASAGRSAAENAEHDALSELPPELLIPGKPILFKTVIRATTHHALLDLNLNNPKHLALKNLIGKAAEAAGRKARTEGIHTARANEAGNQMEDFVKDALREVGLDARTPVDDTGRARSTGYPDVEILGPVPCYLELKTFSARTANTTQRSFYYSPSEHPKVTHDAVHLLLGFQMERTESDGQITFRPVRWKLITLQNLKVELKAEFNQSNRGLYGANASDALLSEGTIQ